MKFVATLDRDEDGVWIAECPSIPGCVSEGETKEAALENLGEAIGLVLRIGRMPLGSAFAGLGR